jgi:hypothetical protein
MTFHTELVLVLQSFFDHKNNNIFHPVHTHLFPDTHGELMLWGIDELLTYHYLVAEYFQTGKLPLDSNCQFSLSIVAPPAHQNI